MGWRLYDSVEMMVRGSMVLLETASVRHAQMYA